MCLKAHAVEGAWANLGMEQLWEFDHTYSKLRIVAHWECHPQCGPCKQRVPYEVPITTGLLSVECRWMLGASQ